MTVSEVGVLADMGLWRWGALAELHHRRPSPWLRWSDLAGLSSDVAFFSAFIGGPAVEATFDSARERTSLLVIFKGAYSETSQAVDELQTSLLDDSDFIEVVRYWWLQRSMAALRSSRRSLG